MTIIKRLVLIYCQGVRQLCNARIVVPGQVFSRVCIVHAQAAEKTGAPVLGADTNPFLLQPLWEDQASTGAKPDGCVVCHKKSHQKGKLCEFVRSRHCCSILLCNSGANLGGAGVQESASVFHCANGIAWGNSQH